MLLVGSGSVIVDICDADCPQVMRTMRLKKGEKYDVKAGMSHRLRFDEECQLLETYHPTGFLPATIADIVRVSPGWEAGMELPGQVA